jgi:ABC-type phosphate/phosphonate transport system substrate-binding protein
MGTEALWLGAVAYDPKVVTIWEGMRTYLHEEAKLDVDVVLFLSYEAQVDALLSQRIDIGWNTNLAYLQADVWSEGQCAPLAMRDSDLGWKTHILALNGAGITKLEDLRGKRIALGSKDSAHAAILPVHFLEQHGLVEGKDYTSVRFDSDVGKHGDTGSSEVLVLKAVMDGRADAGAVGSPFWTGMKEKALVPQGAVAPVWTSPGYSHCMFSARRGLDAARAEAFVRALSAMTWENPKHRAVLEAEGLKKWLRAQTDGYASLREAAKKQGFFNR